MRFAFGFAALALTMSTSCAFASELVTNGDFSAGNTGFTSGYTKVTTFSDTHGVYDVRPADQISNQTFSDWTYITKDASDNASGNVFLADGPDRGTPPAWSQTVAVLPNSTYVFSFYAAEVSNPSTNAQLVGMINGMASSDPSGTVDAISGQWIKGMFTWNSGSNTTAILSIVDQTVSGPYNDFALDNISFEGPAAVSAVPEPSTWAMMLFGFSGIGFLLNRRSKRAISRAVA